MAHDDHGSIRLKPPAGGGAVLVRNCMVPLYRCGESDPVKRRPVVLAAVLVPGAARVLSVDAQRALDLGWFRTRGSACGGVA